MANSNNSVDPVYTYIKAIALLIVFLASLYEANAQVYPVKDPNTGADFSKIKELTSDGSTVWFSDQNTGAWATDGAAAGTLNIREPLDQTYKRILKTNKALYVIAHADAFNEERIMYSNGTEELLVLDYTSFKSIKWLKEVNGVLYFAADQEGKGTELWKSNGDFGDVTLVMDIFPGEVGSNPSLPFAHNGVLYFRADDGVHGSELWKCEDATASGTKMVKDIYAGNPNGNPQELIAARDKVYFNATSAEGGQELWVTDGTEEGTHIVKDMMPGTAWGNPLNLVVLNDIIYFFGYHPEKGYELWRSDGTEAGTYLVKDTHPATDNYNELPDNLVVVSGSLYFSASDGNHGVELWKSDGTESGTFMLKDLTPGAEGSELSSLTQINERLFFVESNKLWRSNGTACSTVPVLEGSGIEFSDSFTPVAATGKMYFEGISNDGIAGLYYYDFSTIDDPGCTQIIAFEMITPKAIGDASFQLEAGSSSGLPLTFSVSGNDVVAIEGNTVTIVGAGQAIITATQAGNTDYHPATAQQTLTVNKKGQVIIFEELAEKIAGQQPFMLQATSSSGLAVSYASSNDNVASIIGNTVTIHAPGNVSITASQNGNSEFSAAPPATRSLTVKLITGIEENADKLISLYPNPVNDYVVVNGSVLEEGFVLNLLNMNGGLVSSSENETRLDVSNLPAGIYIIQVTTKELIVTKRIVKK